MSGVHPMRAVIAGLAAGVFAAGIIACASVPSAQQAPTTSPRTGPMPGDNRDEITRLMADIDREKADQAAVPESAGASCGADCQAVADAVHANDNACSPPPTQTCTDMCKLGTTICETKDKICNLASQMRGDQWAADKCTDATTSCTNAHDKCCTCH